MCRITITAVFTPYSEDDEAQLEKIPGAFGNYGTDNFYQISDALEMLKRSSERILTAQIAELEKKVKELERRLREVERQVGGYRHIPNLPLRVVGKPFPPKGTPIIPEVD